LADLTLTRLTKSFGATEVLRPMDLRIEDGEFAVFVGPSGCGKSTLLRTIAGLEDATSGDIHIGGERANDVDSAGRGLSMVFQNYALYPHMTVFENMAFGLSIARRPKAEIRERVTEAARILKIEHLLDRRPKTLSGGQRQRVAIGRAIVRKPKIFLFDEPLSNLDAELRVQMRIELARLHAQLGATMIYVTHDQVEAMTLADKIVVLRDGVIEQVGSPLDLYNAPVSRFVAGFIGSPSMNFLPAEVERAGRSGLLRLAGGGSVALALDEALAAGEAVTVGVRPENLALRTDAGADGRAGMPARILLTEQLGNETHVHLRPDGAGEDAPTLIAQMPGQVRLRTGERVGLVIDPGAAHVFGADGLARRGPPARAAA
jgi:multiple sugar transport system ATP-binding protein